ncbi:MAG: M48 family metallopeptidase, partial [Spirochaetia bacterium]|nr:M48 family metallopeptidase [Spirochaetia bacterium]
ARLAVLFSGVLPWTYAFIHGSFGTSLFAEALFPGMVLVLLSLVSLPFDAWFHFRIEEKHGFNRQSARLWILDRVKGFVLSALLFYPLFLLLLALVGWTGKFWWVWGFAVVSAFQILMMMVAPRWIMPLFNKFEALPEGALREKLFALAKRTGFPAGEIQVMDGSKRSAHSNAFFTGLGKIRKIVLFDTLLKQLSDDELESVLAHEIGHYRLGHIRKRLVFSFAATLVGFFGIYFLSGQEWFYSAFGFDKAAATAHSLAPAFLLTALASPAFLYWFTPLSNLFSRKHEYEADAFAREAMGTPDGLIRALHKLAENNLSQLDPDPVYSAFYYSHPALPEREKSLRDG